MTSGSELDDGWLVVDGARITDVGTGPGPAERCTIELGSEVVTPGFVDLHVHGGGGRQVSGDTAEEVAEAVCQLAHHHLRHGTTALVPTTVSDTLSRLEVAVRGVALAMRDREAGEAAILGVHMEGPWLASGRAGAHEQSLLRSPHPAELEALMAASGAAVRLVTFAPELPGAAELLAAGRASGITMAVGHTDADFDTVREAFAGGARHVTHLGNAMPGVDRRAPGPIAAALADGRATLEVIADGVHVHRGFLSLVGAVAPGRLVAVTDAIAACGMPPGNYRLGSVDVVVDAERAVLAEQPGTLAGSVLTMDRAVATLVDSGVGLPTAVLAATGTPAGVVSAIGKGHLRSGADADIVVLDARLRAVATVVGGRVVWDPDGRLDAVGEPAGPRSEAR
ncbi:MAG: N-acetylglucosamine-6-phosphate deacetylase [Actinomycetes bacterium]